MDGKETDHTSSQTKDDRRHRAHERGSWGDGDQPGNDARAHAQRGGLAVTDDFHDEPGHHAGGASQERVGECLGSESLSTGVKPEPAEPQHTGAQEHKRKVVGRPGFLAPVTAFAQHDGHGQCSRTSVDMNRSATSSVVGRQCVRPAAIDPEADRRVNKDGPHGNEDHPRGELHPVSDRAGDQGRCDHCEGQQERPRCHVSRFCPVGLLHPDFAEFEEAEPFTVAVAVGDRHAHNCPDDGHDAQAVEVHVQHVEHILRTDHAAVKKCQTRNHQQHQRC